MRTPCLTASVGALVLSGLVQLLSAGTLAAQPPVAAGEPRDTFEETLSVFEVLVPVQVLRKGTPVVGLQAKDFAVFDRGVEREIVGFEVVDVRTERIVDRGEAAPELSLEQNLLDANRHFLALFDFGQSPGRRLALAVDSVREMLTEQMHPSDRVAVAMLGGWGVRLIVAFTEDRDRASSALDFVQAVLDRKPKAQRAALRALHSGRAGGLRELSYAVGPAAALALGSPGGMRISGLQTGGVDLSMMINSNRGRFDAELDELVEMADGLAAGSLLSRIRYKNRSVASLVTLLQGVPDPKYLLLFSGGLPGFASVQQGFSPVATAPALIGHGITRAYADLVKSLRESGWAVHSFDVASVGMGDSDSLLFLSLETGGKLYDNYGRLGRATDRFLEQTSVTYQLSVRVEDLPRDGAYHRLKVRLPSQPKDVQVIARDGYYAPKTRSKMSPLERSLASADELFSAPDQHDFGATPWLVRTPDEEGKSTVHLLLAADLSPLIETVGLDRTLRLELQAFAAEDHGGRPALVDLFSQSLELDVDRRDELLARGGLKVAADLELGKPGPHLLRFRIREPRSRRQYLHTHRMLVEPTLDRFLGEPLILGRGGESVVVREAGSDSLRSSVSPFVVGGITYLPARTNRVPAEQGTVLLVHAFGRWSDASVLEAILEHTERAGAEARAAPLSIEKTLHESGPNDSERTSFLGWLDTSGMAAGELTLRFRWRESGRVLSEQSLDLIIE